MCSSSMPREEPDRATQIIANVLFTLFSVGFFVFVALKCYILFRNFQNEQNPRGTSTPPTSLIKSQPELERRMKTKNMSNCFKLKYCETLKKPMMIGVEDGRTKHFEWEDDWNAFVSECSSCKFDEENPPSYSSMFP